MTSIRNKDLVTRKRLSTSVDKDILKESKKISDDTKIPFSTLGQNKSMRKLYNIPLLFPFYFNYKI